jgi:[calcium/calmodulin-dependent protein kinase] kinase
MKAVTKFKSLLHKSRPTGLDGVDAPPHTSGSAKTDRRNVAAPSTDGTHHDDVSSSAEPTGVTDYFRQNPKSPALAERSSSSDTPKPKRPERVHTSASEKGQAHDPLTEEPLFLGIGAGRNNSFGPPGQEEVPDDGVIAESPLAAEFSIYEHAYQQEVERIRGEQGHRATVYLNRRVDSKDAYKGDDNMVQAPSKSSLWGQVRDHLLEKGGESQSRQSEQS